LASIASTVTSVTARLVTTVDVLQHLPGQQIVTLPMGSALQTREDVGAVSHASAAATALAIHATVRHALTLIASPNAPWALRLRWRGWNLRTGLVP